jgi:photosystem II stability/assembly factor-like uncharacterized protein
LLSLISTIREYFYRGFIKSMEGFSMWRLRIFLICFFLIAGIFSSFPAICSAETTHFSTETLDKIKWRAIGPAAFGGRIADIQAVINNPSVIFVGAAHGGIFKTENNGTTWKAVFDKEGSSLSIGAIAIAPSDSNIVWAGTGEPNNRNSSSWGDGVYKSLDGGETWKSMGLKETEHIGRIVINPRNPEIVLVAALGHLWGPNIERGLYKTINGGRSWEKVLYINEDTGVVDVAMEDNGRILYAAAYQRRRRAWGFVGGGPSGGIYRSRDGGDSWEKLGNGLPEGDYGRIGLDISKSSPNIVYALIENRNGGLFKSEDRGQSWTRECTFNGLLFSPVLRPMYFAQIRVDPNNPDKVWVLGAWLFVSKDGGKTFTSEGTLEKVHWDLHALWINPNNSDHLLLGTDGGLYLSDDGSKTWTFVDNLPLPMYYAIGIDNRNPYWIYGGTQDCGAFGIPSKTSCKQGILNSDVIKVLGGDAFCIQVDPNNSNDIFAENYAGGLFFINMITGEKRDIRPVPMDPEKETYRFSWSTPLLISPHDPTIIYYGGNKLFRTSDRGYSWEEISPDLTSNRDWKKIPIMGVERNENTLARDDGVLYYGAITAISESPIQPGLIYVGTDDGNVHLTFDGGKNWQRLTDNFRLPGPRFVSRIIASRYSKETAYISFDGHWDDDFAPYIFKTTDSGKTWKSISADLPNGMVVRSIAEDPYNPDLLFAGTEFGLFISINGGNNWTLVRGNLPRAAVDDIIVNERDNDLILGTHGRGIFILDDIAMLEKLNDNVLNSDAYLFPARGAIQFFETDAITDLGSGKYYGPNPDYGALITYYLKSDPLSEKDKSDEAPHVRIVIQDKEGKLVRELSGPNKKGFNRVSWDLHCGLSFDPSGLMESPKGPFVLPGIYSITLFALNRELKQEVEVAMDPRIKTSQAALYQRFAATMTANEIQRAYIEGRRATNKITDELHRIEESLKEEKNVPDNIKTEIQDTDLKVKKMTIAFEGGWFIGIEEQINGFAEQIQKSAYAPTESDLRTMQYLFNKVNKYVEETNALIIQDFPRLLRRLSERKIAYPRLPNAIEPARHY